MSAYETTIPGASVYGGAALLAKTAYQKSLARLNQQRGTTIRNAGFRADIDPTTGMVKGLGVDQTNMYGDFQQLNRQQAQQDESVRWGAQERGLGTGGGLAAQMRSGVRYGFGAQDAKFGMDLQGALSGYSDQQVQMGQTRDAALYEAELAAAREAQQNQDWSPTDYTGITPPDYGEPPPVPPYSPGVAQINPDDLVMRGRTPIATKATTRAKAKTPYLASGPFKSLSAEQKAYQAAATPRKKIMPTPKKKR